MNRDNLIKSANYDLLAEYCWVSRWAVKQYFTRNCMKIDNPKDISEYLNHRKLHISGVYSITNNITWKRYIWSSKNLHTRKLSHLSSLLNWKHKLKDLQNDFNKFWRESFSFSVLYQNKDRDLCYEKEKEIIWGADILTIYNIADTFVISNIYKEREFIWECLNNKELIKEFLRRSI